MSLLLLLRTAAPLPKLSTLTDDFPGTSLDASWVQYIDDQLANGGGVVTVGSKLVSLTTY